MIDVVCIFVVLIFVGLGFVRGILHEALAVGGLVASYAGSRALGRPLTRLLLSAWSMPAGAAENLARIFAGTLMFLSLLVAVRMIDKHVGRTRRGVVVPWNRNLGALAGVAFGAGVVFSVLCVVDAFYKVSPGGEGWWSRAVADSSLRGWVQKRNPADRLLVTDSLKFFRAVAQDEELRESLKASDEFRQLWGHETVEAIREDTELMTAITSAAESKDLRQFQKVGKHKKVHALLKDRKLRAALLSPDLRRRMRELVEAHAQGVALDIPGGQGLPPDPLAALRRLIEGNVVGGELAGTTLAELPAAFELNPDPETWRKARREGRPYKVKREYVSISSRTVGGYKVTVRATPFVAMKQGTGLRISYSYASSSATDPENKSSGHALVSADETDLVVFAVGKDGKLMEEIAVGWSTAIALLGERGVVCWGEQAGFRRFVLTPPPEAEGKGGQGVFFLKPLPPASLD